MYSTIMNDGEGSVQYSSPLWLGGCMPFPLCSDGNIWLKDVCDILRYDMPIYFAPRG